MAIQGIIKGFADPAAPQSHVVLSGRGSLYVLIVDGRESGKPLDSLEAAFTAFAKASDGKPPGWRAVTSTTTDSMGTTRVTQLGVGTLGAEPRA